jgi:hypothetical protein
MNAELREWLGLTIADLLCFLATAAVIAMFVISGAPVVDVVLAIAATALALGACVSGMRQNPLLSRFTNITKRLGYPFFAVMVLAGIVAHYVLLRPADEIDREAEKLAIATAEHPFAGFWKRPGCGDNFGLAIAPAGPGVYSVSFCGPGGCFKPGAYRPNTGLVGDAAYRVVDADAIEVRGREGFSAYVRCKAR